MRLELPAFSLVVLVGPSGAGKSTFAARHFRPTEVLSTDSFRGLVCDDETDQSASGDAFALLHFALAKRLARRRLTVIDATSVQAANRRRLLQIAQAHRCPAVALVFRYPESVYQEHNRRRAGRTVPPEVVSRHVQQLQTALAALPQEGFHTLCVLTSPAEADALEVVRLPLPVDRRDDHGPFDIIGDVHGCFDELLALLGRLGWRVVPAPPGSGRTWDVTHPQGRKLVFLGDLVDRGPRMPDVLRLVMDAVDARVALCVIGNHDDKLLRKLWGRNVVIAHGLAETLAQLDAETPQFRERVLHFLEDCECHYLLDGGRLVVAHAGLKEEMQGRIDRHVRNFALYGEVTGETDALGLPVRGDWARDYHGAAFVVYGHTPVAEPCWVNRTINIDNGCVFGGRLSGLRYPEMELVSVPALRQYSPPHSTVKQKGPVAQQDGAH